VSMKRRTIQLPMFRLGFGPYKRRFDVDLLVCGPIHASKQAASPPKLLNFVVFSIFKKDKSLIYVFHSFFFVACIM
jgi:hypothetical protein